MDSIWCQGAGSISIKIMQNFQQFAIFSKRKKSDYYMADYAISFASTSHRKLIVVIFQTTLKNF